MSSYYNLSEDEIAIIKSFRQIGPARQQAVKASKNSFMQWLEESVTSVWKKVTHFTNAASEFVDDIWRSIKSFF